MKPINRFEDIPDAKVARSIWEHVEIIAPYEQHAQVYRLLRESGEWYSTSSGPRRISAGAVDPTELQVKAQRCHGPVLRDKQLKKLKDAVERIIDYRLQEGDLDLRWALETLCARAGVELYPEPPK